MKKRFSFLLALALVLTLAGCSSGEVAVTPAPAPVETVAAVPDYSLIDADRYEKSGGIKGIGYRVVIGDEATEEGMRAVFADLCSADSYDLHTIWFYGLASDVDDVGSFTVGMLEEDYKGADPTFTPCTYGAELIASMRENAAEEAKAAELARSIPAEAWTGRHDLYLSGNSFSPVDKIIFSTFGSENGLGGSQFFAEGEVLARFEAKGYDVVPLSTEDGVLYLLAADFDLPDMSEGDSVTTFFVYSGWSDVLDGPVGDYVYHE